MLCSHGICSWGLPSHPMEHRWPSNHLRNVGLHVLATRHSTISRGRFNPLTFHQILISCSSYHSKTSFNPPAKKSLSINGIFSSPRSLHRSSNRLSHRIWPKVHSSSPSSSYITFPNLLFHTFKFLDSCSLLHFAASWWARSWELQSHLLVSQELPC